MLGLPSRQDWADYWHDAGAQAEAAGQHEHANYYRYYGDQNQNAATTEERLNAARS